MIYKDKRSSKPSPTAKPEAVAAPKQSDTAPAKPPGTKEQVQANQKQQAKEHKKEKAKAHQKQKPMQEQRKGPHKASSTPSTASELRRLEGAIQRCSAAEEFEEAAKLRDQLKLLQAREVLEGQMQRHVAALEFEQAAKVRDSIRALQGPLEFAATKAPEKPVGSQPQKAKKGPGKEKGQASGAAAKAGGPAPTAPAEAAVLPRTVLLSGLPGNTSKKMLRAAFPAALYVKVHVGKAQGTGELVFDTVQTAAAQVAKGGVEVGGRTVELRMAVDPKLAGRCPERQVFVGGLPLTVTQAGLASHFPAAEKVELRQGKCRAYAFVTFPTAKEAVAAAAKATVTADGHTATLRVAEDEAAHKAEREEWKQRTVHVGPLPLTAGEAELRRLFPAAVEVRLRPSKDKASALVVLPTAKDALAAVSAGTVKLNGSAIAVNRLGGEAQEAYDRAKEERNRRTVYVGSLPLTLPQADLAPHFPTAEKVELIQAKKHAYAFVVFPTAEAAAACVARGTLEVGGQSANLRLAGTRPDQKRTVEAATPAPAPEAKRRKP